jgi:adenine-specific DNA-methyltransferase
MSKEKSSGPTPIEAIRHQDTRVSIPTEELRDFVVKDEEKPRTVLYPRDLSPTQAASSSRSATKTCISSAAG